MLLPSDERYRLASHFTAGGDDGSLHEAAFIGLIEIVFISFIEWYDFMHAFVRALRRPCRRR